MKKSIFAGLFALLLFSSLVLATEPTTPTTISPVNNSVYFNDPTLTCSGSTDAENDDINYTFYGTALNVTYKVEDEWNKIGLPCATTCTFTEGNSLSTNYLGANFESDIGVYRSYKFTGDYWVLETQTIEYDGALDSALIQIDGNTVLTLTTTTSAINRTIDVSSYNDGSSHIISFLLNTDWDNDQQTFRFYWDDINSTSAGFQVLQNSSLTTYEWDSPVGLGYWYCNACDNNSECSDNTETRTISKMSFNNCTSGNRALNFTIRDEENESALIGDMDGTLTLDSQQDSKAYSFDLNDNSNFGLCLDPSNINVNVSGFMEYLPDGSGYTYPRQYYFDNNQISGDNTQDISLYSLLDSLSSAVTFTASKAGALASDILIHLQKYDPATNAFRLVAMGQTSSSGTDIIYLRLTDAWYRILAYDEGELAFTSGPEHITSTSYIMYLSSGATGEDALNEFGEWLELGSINFNLNYSNSSQSFQLVADDSSGASTSMCLKVDKHDMLNGTSNVCYQCVNSASVSISCAITDIDAYYTAQFIGYTNNTWRVLGSLTQDLSGKIADTIGKDGTFYAFLLIGVSAFAAIWSPAAAIVLSLFSVSVMSVLGFIDVAWGIVMLLIVTGMALLTVMYKRRSM